MRALDASALAAQAGTVKAANVVMLGAVASALPFPADAMEAVIRRSVPPKTIDVNLEAFPPRAHGRSATHEAYDCQRPTTKGPECDEEHHLAG